MTADVLDSILEAELDTSRLLLDTLDRQREALIARDVEQIDELTDLLENQMTHFNTLVETRMRAMRADDRVTDRRAELMRRIRHTEARMLRLARLNHDLIADRLSYVGAMLATLGLRGADGYGPERTRSGALLRSA